MKINVGDVEAIPVILDWQLSILETCFRVKFSFKTLVVNNLKFDFFYQDFVDRNFGSPKVMLKYNLH